MTTYRQYEDSVALGRPVELYDFYDEEGTHWRFNSGGDTVTYGGYAYGAGPVTRGAIEIGGSVERNTVEITLPRDNAMSNLFRTSVIDTTITLIIYRQHVDQYATFWQGTLVGLSFDGDAVPTVSCEPLTSSSKRLGRRRRAQRPCDRVLYDARCGVNAALFAVSGTIDSVTGTTLVSSSLAAKADTWFNGGVIKIGNVWRFIVAHSGSILALERAFANASAGDAFTAYAGCNLQADTCRTKFNNIANFGGLEYIPIKDPYSGSITE